MDFDTLVQLKLAGTIEKSTQILKSINALVKLPQLQATMVNFQREMEKV
jgi:charged multivesicular body protein 3